MASVYFTHVQHQTETTGHCHRKLKNRMDSVRHTLAHVEDNEVHTLVGETEVDPNVATTHGLNKLQLCAPSGTVKTLPTGTEISTRGSRTTRSTNR